MYIYFFSSSKRKFIPISVTLFEKSVSYYFTSIERKVNYNNIFNEL